jgi:hypothetical protein
MTLSDRLAAAAKERSNGTTGATDVANRGVKSPSAIQGRDLTIVIGAHVPISAVEPDPAAEPDAVCPTCGRTGELGVVDLHRRTSDWTCSSCGTMWRLTMPPNPSSSFR